MIFVLGLAGAFARQKPRAATAGTLQTHTPFFVVLMSSTAILVTLLSFVPAVALGPLADSLR
jgi:potassium-transporting ATPase potassium-binding subunit